MKPPGGLRKNDLQMNYSHGATPANHANRTRINDSFEWVDGSPANQSSVDAATKRCLRGIVIGPASFLVVGNPFRLARRGPVAVEPIRLLHARPRQRESGRKSAVTGRISGDSSRAALHHSQRLLCPATRARRSAGTLLPRQATCWSGRISAKGVS